MREEYSEAKHLLRNALENAAARQIERAATLEAEAGRARSDAQRLGRLAVIYGTLPPRRLLPMAEMQSAPPLERESA